MANYRFVTRWQLAGDDIRQCHWDFEADPAADEGDVEAAFDLCWDGAPGPTGGLRLYYDDATVLVSYTWYEGVEIVEGQQQWGDAFRVTERNLPGVDVTAGSKQLPPQLAVVVTKRLPVVARRHQGRAYLPAPTTVGLSVDGRLASPSDFAGYVEEFLEGCLAADWTPVITSVQTGSLAFLPYVQIKVDDRFDTQRRRGFESSLSSVVRDLTPTP